ncbi:MAG: T9SS type A sorting domain-containing protein [Bacteroidia bacterium]|nr:T9SS type A sorting domain-containing protein [Bacteroidia bacterium]
MLSVQSAIGSTKFIYNSSSVTQITTADVDNKAIEQKIIKLTLNIGSTTGNDVTDRVKSLSVKMQNSNNDHVSKAKMYWTGTTNTFSTNTQFGTTIASPSGTITFTGPSSSFATDSDHFLWLVFDLDATGSGAGETVDAFIPVNGLNIEEADGTDNVEYTPSLNNPSGNRTIIGGTGSSLGGGYYCLPTWTDTDTAWIDSISFAGINIHTGHDSIDAFEENTSSKAFVNQEKSYDMIVDIRSVNSNANLWAWFDWNNDGDFSDSNESFDLGETTSPSEKIIQPITIPTTTVLGYTRMRVAIKEGGDPNYCVDEMLGSKGETEDYAIEIQELCTSISATLTENQQATCNNADGQILVESISGGTPPYQFTSDFSTWQPDSLLVGFTAGSHIVTIMDANGCKKAFTKLITVPGGVTANIFTNIPKCNNECNGRVLMRNVTGGTKPYSFTRDSLALGYQPDSSFSGLCRAPYTITIKDSNGCRYYYNTNLSDPPLLNAYLQSITNTSCFGKDDGTAIGSGSGGSGNHSYSWSIAGQTNQIIQGLNSGVYTITVTDDSGCVSTSSVAILSPPSLVLNSSVTGDGCDSLGATITLKGLGGTQPYIYSWQDFYENEDTLSGLTAGSYSPTVTDANNCIKYDEVTVLGNFEVYMQSGDLSECGAKDGSAYASVVGGLGQINYMWSNGSTSSSISNAAFGNYSVTIRDTSNCTYSTVVSLDFISCSGIISGMVFNDINGDGIRDSTEMGIPGVNIYTPGWNSWAVTNHNGNYSIQVSDTGSYDISIKPPFRYACMGYAQMIVTTPVSGSYDVNVTIGNLQAEENDFGLQFPSTSCGLISGQVYNDINGNGVKDSGEPGIAGRWVRFSPYDWAQTDGNGNYIFSGSLNANYTISINLDSYPYYYCPSGLGNPPLITQPSAGEYSVTLTSSASDVTDRDFGIQESIVLDAMIVSLRPYFGYHSGTDFKAWMDFKIFNNISSTCTLVVQKDPFVSISNASLPVAGTTDTTITWIVSVDGYNFWHCMHMDLHLDADAPYGYMLEYSAEIGCDIEDYCPNNNYIERKVKVGVGTGKVGSLDNIDNRMYLFHTGNDSTNTITLDDSTFSYEIGYHNTIGDTVFSMVIVDTLPDYLDASTVSKPFSPHHPKVTIIEPNILLFVFDEIVLLDTSVSPLESYGFVQFNVNMKPNLAPGTQIDNRATIIMNSERITTNTVTVTIKDSASSINPSNSNPLSLDINLYPNPNSGKFGIRMDLGGKPIDILIQIININGQLVFSMKLDGEAGEINKDIDLSEFTKGVYTLKILGKDWVKTKKVIYR